MNSISNYDGKPMVNNQSGNTAIIFGIERGHVRSISKPDSSEQLRAPIKVERGGGEVF